MYSDIALGCMCCPVVAASSSCSLSTGYQAHRRSNQPMQMCFTKPCHAASVPGLTGAAAPVHVGTKCLTRASVCEAVTDRQPRVACMSCHAANGPDQAHSCSEIQCCKWGLSLLRFPSTTSNAPDAGGPSSGSHSCAKLRAAQGGERTVGPPHDRAPGCKCNGDPDQAEVHCAAPNVNCLHDTAG